MKLEVKRLGEGRTSRTVLRWSTGDSDFEVKFPTPVRATFDPKSNRIYVSDPLRNRIILLNASNGVEQRIVPIPDIRGYQYRGLNLNTKSSSGIAVLYFPIDEDKGNEWRDIEQYEFLPEGTKPGRFLDIYR